jgi:hypothetical protein
MLTLYPCSKKAAYSTNTENKAMLQGRAFALPIFIPPKLFLSMPVFFKAAAVRGGRRRAGCV